MSKTIKISTLGLNQRDKGMLQRGLRLVNNSWKHSYMMVDGNLAEADIIIADADSVAELPILEDNQKILLVRNKDQSLPQGGIYRYVITRPLLAPKVLDALEYLTTVNDRVLNFRAGNEEEAPQNQEADKKILVVDDSLIVREQMKLMLKEFNCCQVQVCSNGQEALKKLKQQYYDIAFVDLIMPGLDGFETCKEIKKIRPETKVVLLTSRDSMVSKIKGRLIGADDYITKPATLEKLSKFLEFSS